MKFLTLILTILLAGCNLAIAQSPYATRLPVELQTAQMDSLADLTWLQGTTPAIRVEPLLRGRPVAVDADTAVRMVIGPSATGTLYAVRTNLAALTNTYEIQWPTIGTNSAGAAWFYTLLFDREGFTYWSGSGKLYIEETTSTASNGLEWIEYTTPNVGWENVVGDPADNAALVQYVEDHSGGSAEDTVARAGVVSNAADIATLEETVGGITAESLGALTEEKDAAALSAVAGVQSNLTAHAADTDNPHGVTAEQLGALTEETDAAALTALRDREEAILEDPYRFAGTWFKGQTHYHTTVSDGEALPEDMAAAYKAAGFDFVVTTDHNSVAPDPSVDGLLYIPGSEETAHTLPGPPSSISPLHVVSIGATGDADYMAAQEVLDAIVAQGAMPVLAHPNFAGYQWTDTQVARAPGFIGVEVFSAKSELLHGGGEGYADDVVDRMLTAGSRAWLYAADDAHKLSEVGQGWVVVCAETLSTNGILAALRRGSFYATQGPELSHSMTGSTVHVETDAPATIRFVGTGGATLAEATSATAASYKAVGGERYVRAIVTRDSDGLMAWGQPYYVRTPIEQPGEQSFAAKEIYASNLTVRGTVKSEDPASEYIFGTYRDFKWNAAAGYQALIGATNPTYNFAGGMGAMSMSTNCNHNGAVGYNVMQAANDSDFNGAIGYMALNLSSNAHYNVAAGAQAMELARNSSYNFAGGVMALSRATAVSNSAAVGAWAGRRATGRDRVYVDSLASDPGAAWSPTNNAIFIDDGSAHIGRGGEHAAGRTNHFRGAWLWTGLPILDYAATAYGWGDHAEAGYLTVETDPIYSAWVTNGPGATNAILADGTLVSIDGWGSGGGSGATQLVINAAGEAAVTSTLAGAVLTVTDLPVPSGGGTATVGVEGDALTYAFATNIALLASTNLWPQRILEITNDFTLQVPTMADTNAAGIIWLTVPSISTHTATIPTSSPPILGYVPALSTNDESELLFRWTPQAVGWRVRRIR